MKPPETMDVRDRIGGFTIKAPTIGYVKEYLTIPPTETSWRWKRCMCNYNSLYRAPVIVQRVCKKGTVGTLESYDERSFYQNNNDVTLALYKIPGYRYRAMIWFNNKTEKRIA